MGELLLRLRASPTLCRYGRAGVTRARPMEITELAFAAFCSTPTPTQPHDTSNVKQTILLSLIDSSCADRVAVQSEIPRIIPPGLSYCRRTRR
jgi:hypothetical protein